MEGNLWATTEPLLTARLDGSHQSITSNPKVCHHVNGNDIKIFFCAEKKNRIFWRLFVKNCLAGFVMRAYLAGIFIIKPKGGMEEEEENFPWYI